MRTKKISIIIPAYNEQKTIYELIKKVNSVKFGISKEIIVVNDGSHDNTLDEVMKAKKKFKSVKLISYNKNKGKGYAVQRGIKESTGDIIVIQDADLEYDPKDLKKLIKPILKGDYEIVYGSRILGNIDGFNILSHRLGNKILSAVTSLLYSKKITDMETCYKMMNKSVIKKMKIHAKGFEFEPEVTSKILKSGYDILEIPINYTSRSFKEGKKINWRDGIKAIYFLIKYKFFD